MNKNEIKNSVNNVFAFIEKLYLETSYLIREIEGLLADEPEEFIIGRTGGYQVTFLSSKGLEQRNVVNWLARSMAVFFVPKNETDERGGVTITKIDRLAKIIYLRISLNEKEYAQPQVVFGVLSGFQKNNGPDNWPKKIEDLIGHIEYNRRSFFSNLPNVSSETQAINIYGTLSSQPLFDINNSNEIKKLIVDPALKLYREK